MIQKIFDFITDKKIVRFFWALVLLTMPVTSFRFFPGDGSIWRPLAIFPALVLTGLLVLGVFGGKKLFFPQPISKLFVLILFLILASIVINGIYPPADYLGQGYWDRVIRAGITLMFGVVFFFVGLQMNQSEDDMNFTLKCVFVSFIIVAVVGLIQWLALFAPVFFDRWEYNKIHELFMIKGLRVRRLIGLAYEPGWFADQLLFVYIPWFLMAFLTGKRVLKKWWIEIGTVIVGFLLLLFTYSRSGIFLFVIMMGLFLLFYAPRYLQTFFRWFFFPFKQNEEKKKGALGFRILLIVGLVVGLILIGIIFSGSSYFAKLWQNDLSNGLFNYLQNNSMGARTVYAIMGGKVFLEHPLTGVGFGAVGFHMPNEFPAGLIDNSTEMSRFLAGEAVRFLNTKNMYVRLLAETGIMGFVLFVAFLGSSVGMVWRLRKNENQIVQFVGGAVFLILMGIVIRFFTFDSFASPTIWVTFGILISLISTVQTWESKEGGKTLE